MNKPHPCDISFITINYNGLEDTCELIESLTRTVRSITYEIIVVDNASQGNEASQIQVRYPQVKIIVSSVNKGFSGGNNIGIREASGKYLMLINNDTYIQEDGFDKLIQRFETSSDIGIVCPKIRFSKGEQEIQYAGFSKLSLITLRNKGIGFGEKDNGQYNQACPTAFAHGAAMLIKREVIEQVGLMPEEFFLYYEEMDWSSCIQRKGFQIWYDPCCTVYHKESQSTGQQSPLKTYYMTRNRLLYARKNRFGLSKYLCYLYLTLVCLCKDVPIHVSNNRIDLAQSSIKGLLDFFKKK